MKKTSKNQKAVAKKTVKTVKPTVVTTKATYRAVANNVYFDGYSYRARITVNGRCNSRNFETKTAAIRWRNDFQKRDVR